MTLKFESFPVILGWELTLACNLRCNHCASKAGSPRENELTLEESLAICDQLPALLVLEVVFTGGEPLLCPHWKKIARRLSDLNISVGMVTNGTQLEGTMIQRLVDAGVRGLAVSLDGEAETHDRLRGVEGLHRRVLAGIDRLLESGLRVTVITTVHRDSLLELQRIQKRLQNMGVRRWQLQPAFGFGRMQDMQEQLLSDADYLQLGRYIQKAQSDLAEEELQIFPADGVGYFSELDGEGPQWLGCSAGITTCGITSNGKIKGCLSWPDQFAFGDLRTTDLWDIWFSPDAFPQTRQFRLEDIGGTCRDCKHGEVCKGGCSAMSYSKTGQFHADPYCFRAILQRIEEDAA